MKINSAFGPKCSACKRPLLAQPWACIFCEAPNCTSCYHDHVAEKHPEQYTAKIDESSA